MRQRLALARAYAVKQNSCLMAEPFGRGLSAQTRSTLQNLSAAGAAAEGKQVM